MNSNSRSSHRRRIAKLVALVSVVTLGAAACTSDPSAKRVAQDLVNTLVEDTDQRDCMLEQIDSYSKDQLKEISEKADEIAASQNVGEVSAIQQFENDLAACRTL